MNSIMFENARLKLTAWYLLIIMLVSVLFSVAFYNLATREIQRIIKIQELRTQNREELRPTPDFIFRPRTIADLQESEQRLKIILLLINGGIFVLAGGTAYFLAGRTLKPIREMVDEQNRFITDASHEMRTPLTSLRSEIEVTLRDKKITIDQARKILESNLEEVVSLQTLANSLLELSQKGKSQNVDMSDVSIKNSFDQALRKLNGSIVQKKINIEHKVEDVHVQAIQERLVELLVILLDNAVKYSPPKSKILITVRKLKNKVRMEIKDTGMGITKEDLPHIFDRFFRSDKSRSKTSGYGLGLAIAREIVSSHNGTIDIISTPNRGTTVIVEF